MRHIPQIRVYPDGSVARYGVLTDDRVLIHGVTPKYAVDCSEWFQRTFTGTVELKKK